MGERSLRESEVASRESEREPRLATCDSRLAKDFHLPPAPTARKEIASMKNLLLAAIIFIALPLAAQQTSVTVWVSSQQNDSGTSSDDARIDNGSGFGLSLARHFTPRLSGELAVFRTSSTTRLLDGFGDFVDIGDLEMMPVTAMLRWHFRSGQPLGMYVGAGIAHVMVDDIESALLRANGIDSIEVGDETTGIVGVGVTYDFSDRWGIAADARYMPLSLSGGPAGTEELVEADLDPLILSAGVRLRF